MATQTFKGFELETCPRCNAHKPLCDWCGRQATIAMHHDPDPIGDVHDHACITHATMYAETYN